MAEVGESTVPSTETPDEGPPPSRWEVELEFVQGLANPMYVHFLAQNQYLENREFLNYLEYLEYWRTPEHVKYIVYPNCLLMLTLLKEPAFRKEISKIEVAQMIMDAFFHKWDGSTVPAINEAIKQTVSPTEVKPENASPEVKAEPKGEPESNSNGAAAPTTGTEASQPSTST